MIVTTNEAAEYYKICRQTLVKHAHQFGGFKIGKVWRFNIPGEAKKKTEVKKK